MKTILTSSLLLALSGLNTLLAQPVREGRRTATTQFILTDSTVVVGRLVQQDSSVVIVRKRNGDLTYLQPSQIISRVSKAPDANPVMLFSLKDSSTVYGRIVNRTPVAVVVQQANGVQTYIDPADILKTSVVTAPAPLPSDVGNNPEGTGWGVVPYLMNGKTASTPRAGTVYYRNTYLIRNELEAGITSSWSVGVVVNPLMTGLYDTSQLLSEAAYTNANFGTQLYSRIAVPLGRSVRIGAGLMLQLQRPEFASKTLNSLLGRVNATFGDERSNITLGYTFRLDKNFPSRYEEGWLSVGAMQRLSPSLTFITDNSIGLRSSYSGTLARLAAALRIQSRYHAFDLGLLSSVSGFGFNSVLVNAYPYVGYTVQFGRRR